MKEMDVMRTRTMVCVLLAAGLSLAGCATNRLFSPYFNPYDAPASGAAIANIKNLDPTSAVRDGSAPQRRA